MARPSDKRRTPRIQPFVAPCRILAGDGRLVGYLTDLSTAGCQVQSQGAPPAPGAEVVLEVRLGRAAAHTVLPARISWARPAGQPAGAHALGLAFVELDADQRRALARCVDEFRRKAAEIGP